MFKKLSNKLGVKSMSSENNTLLKRTKQLIRRTKILSKLKKPWNSKD
jgi:hypothetical protein